MGEKSGGMTNMILIIIALVALIFIVNYSFPNFAETITDRMQEIIETESDYDPKKIEQPPRN